MTADFEGFPAEGLDLLTELGDQDKAWFAEHKKDYQAWVADPAKAFVVAVGELLHQTVSPDLVVSPKANGSISPINNDVRFNPEASTYKDHLLFRWWEGPTRRTDPTLFVRLSADDIGFAVGAAPASLDRWRAAIADDQAGPELEASLAELGKGRTLEVVGEGLKRVPKPYPADHPRAALLRYTHFQARWMEATPKSVSSASFAAWCARRLDVAADVHRWLVANAR